MTPRGSRSTRRTPPCPATIRDIFSVDIPFVPTININATIYGEFRCES